MPARLEVITGPMFSGKSEELIRLLRRATYARKRVFVIKPSLDNRTGKTEIAAREVKNRRSRVVSTFDAYGVSTLRDFNNAISASYCDVLGIEEAQFFDCWIVKAVSNLLNKRAHEDFRIIVSGLDLTAQLEPFGPMPQLLAMADEVQKLSAICFKCGKLARYTQKLGGTAERIQVGDLGLYEARCRECHTTSGISSLMLPGIAK